LIKKTLVIADVHLGIEKELWKEGILVSGLSRMAIERFRELLELTKPKKIIVNGDLRHNIPVFTAKEARAVKDFVELGETYGRVLVVKGNHDGDIEKIIDNVVGSIHREGKFYITHGHVRLDHRPAIIGHVHPAFPIDLHFKKELTKVWLLNENLIVLPAFSPFITGNDVTNPENWLGPVARRENHFDVLTLDGFYLGSVEK